MRTCRVCGIIGNWEYQDPAEQARQHFEWLAARCPERLLPGPAYYSYLFPHIAELCRFCNRGYTDFYQRHSDWPIVRRAERILIQFVSHRLRILAQRHARGLPITRCEAICTQNFSGDRCTNFWSHQCDGHRLCTSHLRAYQRGRRNVFGHDDLQWTDAVIALFHQHSSFPEGEVPPPEPEVSAQYDRPGGGHR